MLKHTHILNTIAIMISITTLTQMHKQIQADYFVSDTKGFINFWFRSLAKRGERQVLKAYANYIMLTSSQRTAHLVIFKISICLCWSRSENSTACLNGRKLNCPFNSRILNISLFKILQLSGPFLLGMTSSTLHPYFLSGVYNDRWWLSYKE